MQPSCGLELTGSLPTTSTCGAMALAPISSQWVRHPPPGARCRMHTTHSRGRGDCPDGLCAAAEEAGFVTDGGGAHCGYIRRAYNIRKNTDQLHRVWVQARFIKPHAT